MGIFSRISVVVICTVILLTSYSDIVLAAKQAVQSLAPPDPYIYQDVEPNAYVRKKMYPLKGQISLYEAKDTSSAVIATLQPGDTVRVQQIDVHVHPIKCLVTKEHVGMLSKRHFASGDIVYAQMYYEEGVFSIWYKGEVFQEYMLGIKDLHQGASSSDDGTWGQVIDKQTKADQLWMKIQTLSGKIGWANPKVSAMGYLY